MAVMMGDKHPGAYEQRGYAAFLLRCWRLGVGDWRIKIEHIRSGQQTQVSSLAEMNEWIAGHPSWPKGRA